MLALSPWAAHADEGWVISSFDAQIQIRADGSLDITETILVDFGSLRKHGIFRDIPVVYHYDAQRNRLYDLTVKSVTDVQGGRHKYEVWQVDRTLRIKIGDPNVYISGAQSYRITYRVERALNGFVEHDELYWNVNGEWPVWTERTKATVILPGEGLLQIACYQGTRGSRETCRSSSARGRAEFEATRLLPEGQQLTVVVAMPKGMVAEPQPKLERKPREVADFFDPSPLIVGGSLALLAAILGFLGWSWWNNGRDRRYTTVYYLTDNPTEETRPLFANDPVVVEYEPPEKLRPAQIGLILDERADTMDITATIIDLAVRGYLRITEVEKDGFLGGVLRQKDWELTRRGANTSGLLEYERIVLDGLFEQGSPVRLSALKRKFYDDLDKARESLYQDALHRQWFAQRPDRARLYWRAIGIGVFAIGIVGEVILGLLAGAALLALPLVLGGLLMVVMASWMAKRTARGREMLRRTLGFRQYVATAEKDRQQFNERQNIFAAYLPYAIVFHCVDKWARAFQGLDMREATESWYTGTSVLGAAAFSRDLQGFSSTVSSTIVSTPGGSGRSGFSSGGFSGGGGGGGGGGSW